MPGPGSHLLYTLGSGLAFKHLSDGRFTVLHCLIYAVNAVVGPDIGPVFEWLIRLAAPSLASGVMDVVHHPVGYILTLGAPLAFLYRWVSSRISAGANHVPQHAEYMAGSECGRELKWISQLTTELAKDKHPSAVASSPGPSGGLRLTQCFSLIAAGCLSHFFLDIPFEENGHAPFYSWILSTGYWMGPAPLYPDSALVIGTLCVLLLVGFARIDKLHLRPFSWLPKNLRAPFLLLGVAGLYCAWCAFNLYLLPASKRRPPVGEEADLGVIIFLAIFFFLPHGLCLASIQPHGRESERPNYESLLGPFASTEKVDIESQEME